MTARTRDRYLTAPEVADLLGLTVRCLESWRYRGAGPPYVRLGRRVRYREADVDRWLGQQETRKRA